MVTWGYVTEQKQNISSSAKPMATRPGRVVTYDKRTSPVMFMAIKLSKLMTYGEVNTSIKSHVFLTTWLHNVTWQTKNGIFLPSEDFWPSNFAGCWHMVREAHNEVARSQEATWSQEVTWSNCVTTRGHVSNWKLNISSSIRPIPPHLAVWWRMTLWPCSLVRSHEKFKTKI